MILGAVDDKVNSTDERFSLTNLGDGDNYKPLDAYFKSEDKVIQRIYKKGERNNSNQTLPKLVRQILKKQIMSLSSWDKEHFSTCKYMPDNKIICEIFSTIDEFKKNRNSIEHLVYEREKHWLRCWF